jgi:hypothetical protein
MHLKPTSASYTYGLYFIYHLNLLCFHLKLGRVLNTYHVYFLKSYPKLGREITTYHLSSYVAEAR